jgi:hypothetical protein
MAQYRWKCLQCGLTSPPVVLAPGQVPPIDAVERVCPVCQDTCVHRADGAPERRRAPRPAPSLASENPMRAEEA